MATFRGKMYRFSFTYFLVIIISVMFLITIVLSFRLLTNDHNCPICEEQIVLNKIEDKPLVNKFKTKHRLAVLVPFRERFEELLEFAPYIHKFLNEQQINHEIFILNQIDRYRFNRASLINVGYIFTKEDFDYIVMHDVDLLPLNKNLSYAYPIQPVHLAAPNLHPRYHYSKFIGGILLINREHFALVNGLSNNYWGWGLEDDEFYVRLKDSHLNITRPDNISTGINDTFRHIHGKDRPRDMTKCYNQREVTRRRDRITGLHNVKYKILVLKKLMIDDAPVTVINIKLLCDKNTTPWCDCSEKKTENKKKTRRK